MNLDFKRTLNWENQISFRTVSIWAWPFWLLSIVPPHNPPSNCKSWRDWLERMNSTLYFAAVRKLLTNPIFNQPITVTQFNVQTPALIDRSLLIRQTIIGWIRNKWLQKHRQQNENLLHPHPQPATTNHVNTNRVQLHPDSNALLEQMRDRSNFAHQWGEKQWC